MSKPSGAKRTAILAAKVLVAVALLAFLVYRVRQEESFAELLERPKDWRLLGAALLVGLTSIVITFVRWMLLVRALDIPFSLHDGLRLGFIGFLFNFVSVGGVGGDLVKAVFIARERPGRRTEAVATVLIDRLVGLYALFLVASGAILFGNLGADGPTEVQVVKNTTLVLTAFGALVIFVLLIPGVTSPKVVAQVSRQPAVGPILGKVVGALRVYRANYGVIAVALLMGIAVHTLASVCVWLIARGLAPTAPTLAEHLLIVPLAALVNAIPFAPSGLGQFEAAMAFLYRHLSGSTFGLALVVAIGFRLVTMIVALGGVYYFIRGRREVTELMHEAGEVEEEETPAPSQTQQAAGGVS